MKKKDEARRQEAQGAGRQTGKERMGGGGEACHVGEVPPWPMDDPKSLK